MKGLRIKKAISICIVIAALIFLMTSYILYTNLEKNNLLFEKVEMTNAMYASFGVGVFIIIMGTILFVGLIKKFKAYNR